MEFKERPLEKKDTKISLENIKTKDEFKKIVEDFLKNRLPPESFYTTTSAISKQNLNTLAKTMENLVNEALTNFEKALEKVISTKDGSMIDFFHDAVSKILKESNTDKKDKF